MNDLDLLEAMFEMDPEFANNFCNIKEFYDKIEKEMKRPPVALQLHLELDLEDLEEEEKAVLRRYGHMKDGISRDIIVPGTMTLHGLHYAIMKAFGWENRHLHNFSPYEAEFKEMTNGGKVREWTRQVGMYFRFPNDDFEDRYWDDDYAEGENLKTWLRSKYCGPYYYGGSEEFYLGAQNMVYAFRKEYPGIQRKTTDQRTWGVYFGGRCEEMIERPMIWTVLKNPEDRRDWDSWRAEKDAVLKPMEAKSRGVIRQFKRLYQEYESRVEESIRDYGSEENFPPELTEMFEEYEFELDDICMRYDPEPVPALSALRYQYDYGDGWEIKITCTNAWYDHSTYVRDQRGCMKHDKNGYVPEVVSFADVYEKQAEGEFLELLQRVARKEKPVCIAWDGMNLMDEVGGIYGYCEFLRTINGKDPEAKKEQRAWAKSMGWTGRMAKTENIL